MWFEKAYGLADRAQKTPFTPATVVQIGSNTKDFTAVSILQLQQHGLLKLEDHIGKYFPSAPADKKHITIAQLMNHTAGFPLGLGGGDFEVLTKDQLIANAMKFKLLFEPGARSSYSNTGYALLAAIIEQVSGKTYDEYVRENILNPLGLTRTGFLLPGFAASDLAHGYEKTGADAGTMLAKPHASDGPYWNLRGNGGMLSTAAEMHAFYKALFETDKLLRPETRKLRFDPSEPIALAGSDLVNFFLYERDPRIGLEMIIASTNATMKAPEIRHEIGPIFGLPSLDGRSGGGGEGAIVRAKGKPVSKDAEGVIREFVATINKGDKDMLRAFISQHFILSSDQPTAEQRAERLSGMHTNLGTLKVLGMTVVDDGSVQVLVTTEREGEAILIIGMEPAAPWRIRRLGVQVGAQIDSVKRELAKL